MEDWIQKRLDGFRVKLLAKYAAEFCLNSAAPNGKQIPYGLQRMLDIPRCGICFSTEGVKEGRCKLCAVQKPRKGVRNQTNQQIRQDVKRAALGEKYLIARFTRPTGGE